MQIWDKHEDWDNWKGILLLLFEMNEVVMKPRKCFFFVEKMGNYKQRREER